MKERRSFSCGCAKIHELPISVLLLSFCLSSLCLSCLSFLSLSRPLPLESRVIASSVVSRRLSSRCASSRSPCASSELLDVSRVVCGVVSVPSRRASSRWSVSVASCAESCRLELLTSVAASQLLGVSRVVCGVLPPSSVSLRCAQSPRRQESRVIRSSVVVDRSLASSGRLSCSVVCVISSCVVPLLASVGLCARRVSRVPFSFLFRLDG